jgi:hypothetical protein
MKLEDVAKEVICIDGNFPVGCLCIYIDCGAYKELSEKSGISHLCEHFFIKLLSNQYRNKKNDDKFSCMGYTDYMYTTIIITFTENYANLIDMIKAINITEDTLNIGKKYFNQCKSEIIKECKDREDDIEKSLKVNSFITNNAVDYVPLGNIEAIGTISYEEFIEFFQINYCNFRCVLLLKQLYNVNNYYFKKSKENNICNIHNNDMIKIRKYRISDQGKQKIYFHIEHEIQANYIDLSLVEYILSEKIKTQLGFNVYFMKKKISDIYIYEILCVNSGDKKVSDDIINFITNYKIKESDLSYAKQEFISQLQENSVIDLSYAIILL